MGIVERAKLRRRKAKGERVARKNANVQEQLDVIKDIGEVLLEAEGFVLAGADDVVFGENRVLSECDYHPPQYMLGGYQRTASY